MTNDELTQRDPGIAAAAGSGGANSPRRRVAQARVFRILNVPMRAVLGLKVPTPLGRGLMLAFIVGRKSGKIYRQPLSYVRDGDVLLTPGGGKWKLNLAGGDPVRLRLRGKDLMAAPELVSDVSEIDRLLGIMVVANPRAASFIGIPQGQDGHFDRAGLQAAVRYGFRIVRWHVAAAAR